MPLGRRGCVWRRIGVMFQCLCLNPPARSLQYPQRLIVFVFAALQDKIAGVNFARFGELKPLDKGSWDMLKQGVDQKCALAVERAGFIFATEQRENVSFNRKV